MRPSAFADPSRGAGAVKNPPANAGDMRDVGSIPGSGRSPRGGGLGNSLQHSCLENPVDRGAWQATVCGAAESHTGLKPLSTHAHMLHRQSLRGLTPYVPPPSLFGHAGLLGAPGVLRRPPAQERPVPSCPWGLSLAGPSPPSNPLTPHLLRKAHRDSPVSHNTCLPAFAPGALGPSGSLIFFPLHLPLLNLLHNLLVY